MMYATAVTDAITTLAEAERRFSLSRTEDDLFFPEWHADLPELTEGETQGLNELRRRYLYQRSESHLLEGTILLLLVSPLLAIAGFYDPPFKIKAEESVRIILEDSEEVLQGRIDVLVLLNRLWVVILESKKTALSIGSALPQTLAYLMANPNPERSSFGTIANGDEILFVKLTQLETRQYSLSRVFSPFTSDRELYKVLQILKSIGRSIIDNR